ncbi:DUF4232 domain-containing protein [Streptomyces nogalater]
MTHRFLLPGILLGCAVLAGCTGRSTDGAAPTGPSGPGSSAATGTAAAPAPSGDGTTGPHPTSASSPSAGTAPSGSARPTASRRCHTAGLKASIGPDHPGAGQAFAIVLTNVSGRTCTVHGFPGVAFVNGAGEAVTPDPERATGEEQRTVTLAPGAAPGPR